MTKHILIISGSRAEWGLLQPVARELISCGQRVTVLATASHLHSQSGYSVEEIIADQGLALEMVYITPESETDSTSLMFATLGNAFIKLPAVLDKLQPDLVVLLGDRYEIFAAATVCRLRGIRIAHISGGELTAGAFDDCLRHCITKLSDLHFTATEEYRKRVIQLGEQPGRVFNVGELALAGLDRLQLKSREQLERLLQTDLSEYFLVTVHSETCFPGAGLAIAETLVKLFKSEFAATGIVFTGANADPEGEQINALLEQEAARNDLFTFVRSLGRINYLSLARGAVCVIGNSSSGIAEVPSLATPVVNIGRRQDGRPHGSLVVSVSAESEKILTAIRCVRKPEFRAAGKYNPYAGEDSARQIAQIISAFDLSEIGRDKRFYDL